MVTAALTSTGATVAIASNAAPMALAPGIVSTTPAHAPSSRRPTGPVTVTCLPPPVQPGQTVALIVGDQLISLRRRQAASTQLAFALSGFTARHLPAAPARRRGGQHPRREPGRAGATPTQPAPMQFDPHQQLVLS